MVVAAFLKDQRLLASLPLSAIIAACGAAWENPHGLLRGGDEQ
jgi:hypothetical protein